MTNLFYYSVEYERLTLVASNWQEDDELGGWHDWEEEEWNPIQVTLEDDCNVEIATKMLEHMTVPMEWHERKDLVVLRQIGSCDYEICLEDTEPDPTLDDLDGSLHSFRGEVMDVCDEHGLTRPEVIHKPEAAV